MALLAVNDEMIQLTEAMERLRKHQPAGLVASVTGAGAAASSGPVPVATVPAAKSSPPRDQAPSPLVSTVRCSL